ncbi:MAG: peptidase domain-containing ABC transporter [Comamonas sp.]
MSRLYPILQAEAGECGLACLAMICNALGSRVDISDLRRRLSISPKGSTLATLIRHAESLGLSGRPLRLELDEISRLRMPCILHWDMNHFVVLQSVSRRGVRILDPAVGARKLPIEAVSRHFTGVALEFTPTPDFHAIKEQRRVPLRDLIRHTRALRMALVQVFFLAVALEVFALAAPFFNQLLIDEVLVTSDREFLYLLATGFGLLLLVQTAIEVLRSWVILRISADVRLQWLNGLFTHLIRLPAPFFERRHLGDITSRFGSIVTIQHTLTTGIVTGILDALMAVMSLAIMIAYSPLLTLSAVTAVAAYAVLRWLFYAPLREASAEQLVLAAKENSHFLETLRAIVSVKLSGHETARRTRWQKLVVDVIDRDVKTQVLSVLFATASTFISGAAALWLLTLGATQVMDNQLSVGMLMAFSSYAGIFGARINHLIGYAVELKMLGLHGERLADIALEEAQPLPTVATDVQRLRPHITLRNLSYRYADGEPWILRHLELDFVPGESVAIVGPSGCGKSTLVKLLLGLLSPTEGEILIDGIPVQRLGLSTYQQLIGAVVQEDSLMAGSIAENISFFHPEINQRRMKRCAHTACIHEEILSMPMGYQTLIGDMGSSLSSGQKQRILIARALYKQPKLLILDEATSHLDMQNEQRIIERLDPLHLTRIYVAHRAETIASAQRVVALNNAR